MKVHPETISIRLSKIHCQVIQSCLLELDGKAGKFLSGFLPDPAQGPRLMNQLGANQDISLNRQGWFDLYQLVNAVMYELGPEELFTITGWHLEEMASVARKIFVHLHGRYDGGGWDERLMIKSPPRTGR
jgi:hypothetical protein